MKAIIKTFGVILFTATLIPATNAFAQRIEATTTTTTLAAGTITGFGPDGIVVTTTTQKDPLRFESSRTPAYVDEAGNPVSVMTVKAGLPVTVYYTKTAGKLVATKVILRMAVVAPDAVVVEEKRPTTPTPGQKQRLRPPTGLRVDAPIP